MKTDTHNRTAIAAAIAVVLGLSAPLAGAQQKPDPRAESQQETKNQELEQHTSKKSGMKHDAAARAPDYSDDDWRKLASSSLEVRVLSALAESQSLRGTDIEVDSDARGTVTLSGEVASEGQKQRALHIAGGVQGVRDVEDELDVNDSLKIAGVKEVKDGDLVVIVAKAIAKEFEGAITKDSWFFGHEVKGKSENGKDWSIEVLSDNGDIELDGELPTNADIQKALQAARRVAGVRAVENDLDTDENDLLRRAPMAYRYNSPGPMYSATLVAADGTARGNLVCHVDSTGVGMPVASRVGDRSDMASAEMRETKDGEPAAKRRDGLDIAEDRWRAMASEGEALRVESALAASPSLQASEIEVEADGKGKVTLHGKVASDRQRERAVRIARNAGGVETVKDDLKVDGSLERRVYKPIDDGGLARTVAEAIAREVEGARVKDSWLFGYKVAARTGENSWSIEVEADSGEVELNGDVPTFAIERKVLRAARSVSGVSNVENDLDTDEDRMLVNAPEAYRYDGLNTAYRGNLYDTQRSALGGALVCQVASIDGHVKKSQ